MKTFQKFLQSTRLYLETLYLIFMIVPLKIRIRRCKRRLWAFPHDPDTIRNLEDELFGCQVEAQSLSVRVHRVMAARKLKAQSAQEQDRQDEWRSI